MIIAYQLYPTINDAILFFPEQNAAVSVKMPRLGAARRKIYIHWRRAVFGRIAHSSLVLSIPSLVKSRVSVPWHYLV